MTNATTKNERDYTALTTVERFDALARISRHLLRYAKAEHQDVTLTDGKACIEFYYNVTGLNMVNPVTFEVEALKDFTIIVNVETFFHESMTINIVIGNIELSAMQEGISKSVIAKMQSELDALNLGKFTRERKTTTK